MRYLLYFPLNIAFDIICLAFNWVVCFFMNSEGNLPTCLKWFQTHDHNLLFTDSFIKEKWPLLADVKPEWLRRYLCAVTWLYRNTGYDFAYSVLGYEIANPEAIVIKGDPKTANLSPGRSGWCFLYDSSRSFWTRAWSLFFVQRYGKTGKCFRMYFGWKLMNPSKGRRMLAMSINPILTFEE